MRKVFVVFLFSLLLPFAANATCDAGYYFNDGACLDCGDGYYCPDGTNRIACSSTINYANTTPDYVLVRSFKDAFSWDWSDTIHAANQNDCFCDFQYHDDTANFYFYQGPCYRGPNGHPYRYYYNCRSGYYAADPLGSGNWYTSCQPCTNKPANSHYTSYSTPSTMYAVENNCPWACDNGYGRTSNNTCEQLCTAGVTGLHTSTGLVFNLYANKQTSPAIHIMPDGTNTICYTSLAPGAANNAVNVEYNGATYHSID